MKKALLLAALAAVTAATTVAAQNPTPPMGRGRGPGGRGGPGGGMMMDRMLLQGITLSADQQTKLEALREADRREMEANRDAQRADMDAIRAARQSGDSAKAKQLMDAQRAKMDARREQQITAIRAMLTSDQIATFDANVAEMRKRMQEGGMRGRGPRPPGA